VEAGGRTCGGEGRENETGETCATIDRVTETGSGIGDCCVRANANAFCCCYFERRSLPCA
jgi:hypothetical protein